MATDSQIDANRENAKHSTGPRTDAGKAISSRNAFTLGLFTKSDYVRPEEQSEYNELGARCVTELMPEGVLEETLVTSIVSATWLLRRCLKVERELAGTDKLDPIRAACSHATQNSINRARAHSSLLLCRSIAELRRLQTDRAIAKKVLGTAEELPPLASPRQIVTAINQHRRAGAKKGQDLSPQNARAHQDHRSLASFCTNQNQIPRNAPCPCGSAKKFKRCCLRNAPTNTEPKAA